MYGKIVYYSNKTKRYYTYKTSSPYKLKCMLNSLREKEEIVIMEILEEWN